MFTIFIRVFVQHSPDWLKFRYCTIAATTNISNRIATNEIKKWSTLKLIADCNIESTMEAEPTPPRTDTHHIAGARCVLGLGFCHLTCALTKWTPLPYKYTHWMNNYWNKLTVSHKIKLTRIAIFSNCLFV